MRDIGFSKQCHLRRYDIQHVPEKLYDLMGLCKTGAFGAELPPDIGDGIKADDVSPIFNIQEKDTDNGYEHPGIPERYVLEVSSPGVERPLTRLKDWHRFAGQQVLVKGKKLPGGKGNRLEGELLGVETGEGGRAFVVLSLSSGEKLQVPLDGIQKAHLLYRWE